MTLSHAQDTGNEGEDSRNTAVHTPTTSNMSGMDRPSSHEDTLVVEGDKLVATHT
jgi:hypothetical protein